MIQRKNYLNKLIKFKDKDLIKIIRGIKGCGKSTMMELYKNYLIQNGISKSQIISLNLEDLSFSFINNYLDLYNYITSKLLKDKKKLCFYWWSSNN